MVGNPRLRFPGIAILALAGLAAAGPAPAQTWLAVGPPGAGVGVIAFDPSDHTRLFAGTGHGVFRSLDGGAHWFSSSAGIPQGSWGFPLDVFALAVSPWNPSSVLAGTDDNVYRSEDGGRTWRSSSAGMITPNGVQKILESPSTPGVVFALSQPFFYRSVDGGATWTLLANAPGGIQDLSFDPTDVRRLVVATCKVFHASLDDGFTWSALPLDPFPTDCLYAFASSTGTRPTYYAVSSGGVFRSEGGAWSNAGITGWTVRIDVDPIDASRLAAVARSGGLSSSADRGATWSWRPPAASSPAATTTNYFPTVARDPSDPSRIFYSDLRFLYRSEDRGITWTRSDEGISNVRVFDLATIPSRPASVLVAGGGAAAPWMLSDDVGSSWVRPDGIPENGWAEVFAYDPARRALYAGGQGLYRSDDQGRTWMTLDTGFTCCGDTPGRLATIQAIAVDPSSANRILIGTPSASKYQPEALSGIFRSEDGGRTWIRSIDGLGPAPVPSIASLLFDESRTGRVLAGTSSGLYSSDDGGVTWNLLGRDGFGVSRIRVDPHDPRSLLAVALDGRVVRSSDRGESWSPSSSGIPSSFVTDLRFDPASDAVYASAYSVGVFRSLDRGMTWQDSSDGLLDTRVTCLAIDESGTRLYAGSANLGVFSRIIVRNERSPVEPPVRRSPPPRTLSPRGDRSALD